MKKTGMSALPKPLVFCGGAQQNILPPALEARFITFFIKNDKYNAFISEFNKLFGADRNQRM